MTTTDTVRIAIENLAMDLWYYDNANRSWYTSELRGMYRTRAVMLLREDAGVVELVDAEDLGSSEETRAGSSPAARTRPKPHIKKYKDDHMNRN